ncbi:MAG: strawberry notch C-terminal domain-containing protein [Cyanobacteria bacterium P01_D01_bin.56]
MDLADQQTLIQQFQNYFLAGNGFSTIVQARQFASDQLGQSLDPLSSDHKQVDEAIEKAIVRSARILISGDDSLAPPATTYQAFDRLTDLFSRQPRLAVRTSTSMAQQAYSTPIPIVYFAATLAGIDTNTTVYEPTAGNGALLISANPALVIGKELNRDRFEELQHQGYARLTQQDACDYSPGHSIADVVIANPPFGHARDPTTGHSKRFTIGDTWSAQLDHAIAFKALDALKDDGRAVLIIAAPHRRTQQITDEYRANQYNERETRGFFFNLYRHYTVTDHLTLDGDLYAKQGAGADIDLIVIQGRRPSRDGPFVRDLPAVDIPPILNTFDQLKERLPNVPLSHLSLPLEPPGESRDSHGEGAPGVHPPDGSHLPDTDGGTSELADVGGDDNRRSSSDGHSPNLESVSLPDRTHPDATRSARQPGGPRRQTPMVSGLGTGTDPGKRDRQSSSEYSRPDHTHTHPRQLPLFQRAGPAQQHQPSNLARYGETLATTMAQPVSAPTQVPYQPRSQGRPMDTLIPRNMANSAQVALTRFEQQHGNIDEFVRTSLGYSSIGELHQRLYAEQIDTIGLAISNLNRGNGFVIGDQTGIGKGCQCAALMAYSTRQGKPVVFFTQKNALYKDILRDLETIGVRDFAPFVTDSNAKIDLGKGAMLRTGSQSQQEQEMNRLMELGNLGSYDAVFTTYSQIQTVAQKEPLRRHFLRSLAERGAILICDESHEAGGSPQTGWQINGAPPNRAEFMRELIDTTLASGGGVVYSSATYSKRPDVMDLYARSTDLRYAVGKHRSLEATLRVGGVPLQQVIAAKYVKSGQMMRRERSFEGVSFDTLTVPADKETADQFSAAMRAINTFDRAKQKEVKRLSKELRKEAKQLALDNAIGQVGVKSTNFTSLMHNCIEQGLLAQKADATVQTTIQELEAGRKPVIALDNTMGAFIDAWAETHDAKPGDRVNITFSDLLARYLERSRDISISDHAGRRDRRPMTDEELGVDGMAAYLEARDIIDDSDLSQIPISPIDYIRGRLEQAGYTTTEVTGRKSVLDYDVDGSAVYKTRSAKEISTNGKIAAVNNFNSGQADVIIINRSGSTGISLHASETFADQRPRVMIVAQASRDINTFMQTLGRIHRTGQVELPNYKLLTTDLPAEKRPAAILSRKMATLNANVTADRETATSIQGVVDFFNEYGETVITQLLEEMPELNEKLDDPLGRANDNDLDLVSKVTGRLPLLPVAEQERTYQLIETGYADLVAQKEAMGESLLQADQLDLDARTIARMEVVPADTKFQTEFSGPVYLEVIDAKSLSKPLTQVQVANQVREFLEQPLSQQVAEAHWDRLKDQGHERAETMIQSVTASTQHYKHGKLASLEVLKRQQLEGLPEGAEVPAQEKIDKLNQKLDAQLAFVTKQLKDFPVGTSVRITRQQNQTTADTFYGVVTGVDHCDRGSAPSVPSSWHLRVALSNGDVKSMAIPLSALNSTQRKGKTVKEALTIDPVEQDMWTGKSIYELFDLQQQDVRQQRQVLTGNLVKACDRYPEGKLLNFTDHKGRIRQGLLLPKSFDIADKLRNEPVVFETAQQVHRFLTEVTEGKGGLKTLDGNLSIRLHGSGEGLILEAPRAKETGGTYYLNSLLIDRIGKDFISRGETMRALVPPENAERTLNTIITINPIACVDPRYLPEAREQMGVKIPELEEAPDGQVLEVEDEFIEGNGMPYVEDPTPQDIESLEALFAKADAILPSDQASEPESMEEAVPIEISSEPDPIVENSQSSNNIPPIQQVARSKYQSRMAEKFVSKFLYEADLAEKVVEGDDFHLKILNEPYIPLVVEAHKLANDHYQLYLTHYIDINGDLVHDGEMVFNIMSDGILQLDQTATQDAFRGGEHRVYDGGDRTFAKMFAMNIRAQGFGEAARTQLAQATITHEEEPVSEPEEITPASPVEEVISESSPEEVTLNSSKLEEIQPSLLDGPASIGDYSLDAAGADPSWGNPEPTEPTQHHESSSSNPEPQEIPPLKPLSINAQREMVQQDQEALITQARAMDLEKVAISLGLERYTSDKSKWHFGSHAISISANKGLFNDWHAHKGGSGAIDLVLHVNEDWDFKQAVEWLTGKSMVPVPSFQEAQAILEAAQQPTVEPLVIPKTASTNWNQVHSYLTQDRQIPADIVNQAFQQGSVFADERSNAVFTMQQLRQDSLTGEASNTLRAGAITGYALRGTDSDYKHITKGSSKADGWFLFQSGTDTQRIVITESPIEALSLAAMERSDNTLYLALNGNSPLPVEQLQHHIDQGGEVITAFNNDAAGMNLSARVLQQIPEAITLYPESNFNDWNEQLCHQPETFQNPEQDLLSAPALDDLRDWYRKASLMQRRPELQAQIAQVGRGEREFTERDAAAMAADNRAFALSERFIQHARHILTQWGQPQADGHLATDTDQYHLRGSPDGLSFSVTSSNGRPLLQVEQGTLSHVTITPNDAQRFETLGAQAQQEQLCAQHSYSSPSHEVSR